MNNTVKNILDKVTVSNNNNREEVGSGEETSGNPPAYTERSPRGCVRTVKLVKTLY